MRFDDFTLEIRKYTIAVFFFQAEDGIRDYKVTGVQTCALPICADDATVTHGGLLPDRTHPRMRPRMDRRCGERKAGSIRRRDPRCTPAARRGGKIGRASCRERV